MKNLLNTPISKEVNIDKLLSVCNQELENFHLKVEDYLNKRSKSS